MQTKKDVSMPLFVSGLSAAQKRMFVLQTKNHESTAYTETLLIPTKHLSDPEYIFKTLAKRHPMLMAKLDYDGTCMKLSYEVNFVSKYDSFTNSVEMKEYVRETTPSFKLRGGPLSQMRIVSTAEQWFLVIHVHHIIVDDVTLSRIEATAIEILEKDKEDSLHESLHDDSFLLYVKYIESENEYNMSEEFNKDMMFWQTVFITCPETASLSILPNTESDSFTATHARTLITPISNNLRNDIKEYCIEQGITEFDYGLACFCVVLQRYLGIGDIVIAVQVSTRGSKFQHTDGLFVNTVLFRYEMNTEHTFGQHIKAVSKSWMVTLAHSKYPLEKVNEMIWERFGIGASSLCTTMFNFETGGYKAYENKIEPLHAKMQISIELITVDGRFDIICEYSKQQIDNDIVDRLNQSLAIVLSKSVTWNNALIKEKEILPKSETDLIRSLSNVAAAADMVVDTPVHEMFVKHANMYPEKEAIYYEGHSMTYSEVYAISETIAYELLKIDRHSTRPVVIFMEKSMNTIAAMLGVWLTGGYFLPISIQHSNDIGVILDEIKPSAVLINKANIKQNFGIPVTILDVSTITPLRKNGIRERMNIKNISLDETAYVIRTSGSTGKPKSIKITHRNLSVLASAWNTLYAMPSFNVRILQWAPISFDVCIGDVIRGLCCVAGSLCLCPDDKRLDTKYITRLIESKEITFAELTPQFGLMVFENAISDELKTLKCLVLGSDVLQKEVYHRIQSKLSEDQRFFNSYGMTEATIDSACFEGKNVPETRQGTVPIGHPLQGVVLYVLDPVSLNPCPVGTIGELYIGGNVIGTGDTDVIQHYLGMILKTNDRACWLPSGHLELLGRLDSIRKLRGFRINTVDIENTILKNSPNVKDVHVDIMIKNTDTNQNQFLCAFVVPQTGSEPCDEKKIRHVVRANHPYYMIPDIVSIVDSIPLTSNGKVDIRALTSLDTLLQRKPEVKNEMSNTANTLQKLFAEVLGINDETSIHVENTFMEQGGNSLILVRFHNLITKKAKMDIKLSDIFTYPSILSLADFVEYGGVIPVTQTK